MELDRWLIDKSALSKLGYSKDAPLWAERISAGLIRISTITRLEIGYSARNFPDLEKAFSTPPLVQIPVEGVTPGIEELAWETRKSLAKKGQHRAPSIPDFMVAATAQLAGLVVLHDDKDFNIISKVTGQRVEKLKVTE
jgi:predicted nucleic acid-binding protein